MHPGTQRTTWRSQDDDNVHATGLCLLDRRKERTVVIRKDLVSHDDNVELVAFMNLERGCQGGPGVNEAKQERERPAHRFRRRVLQSTHHRLNAPSGDSLLDNALMLT